MLCPTLRSGVRLCVWDVGIGLARGIGNWSEFSWACGHILKQGRRHAACLPAVRIVSFAWSNAKLCRNPPIDQTVTPVAQRLWNMCLTIDEAGLRGGV